MKTFLQLLLLSVIATGVFAQAPQKMNYQGVARDNAGNVLANQNIGLRLSILSGSVSGTVEFSETQSTTTNDFGLFNIQIGAGTVVSSTGEIGWGSASHYLKVEMDATGGTNYVAMGTSELVSVPYAFYAEKAGNMPDGTMRGEMLYWDGNNWVQIPTGATGSQLTYCYGKPTWGDCMAVGDLYQGGRVAKVLQPWEQGYDNEVPHGLIVSAVNQGSDIPWSTTNLVTGATDASYGAGSANTNLIVAAHGAGYYAAWICDTLTLNGYSDWYLPSLDEAIVLNQNRVALGLQNVSTFYWTSTEENISSAYVMSFNGASTGISGAGKSPAIGVRAVRTF
ncbi:MAG: DUF1566 domain-containing protein [Flavobacteriales bacterium]|nr:DUF1566 domain-containing protein [Flavobacteriales bacterium]